MKGSNWMFRAAVTILLVFFSSALCAQTKADTASRIEIRQADYLEIIQTKKTSFNKLVNNVILVQKDLVLYCDSALLYKTENIARVYGNVHLVQADSIDAYGDSAAYNGNTKIAELYQNVKLTDRTMTLTTDLLSYDMASKIAIYTDSGKLDNGETTLTSELGYYYTTSKDAYFKNNVVLINPEYRLEADTLQYNTGIERAYFHGPTHIYNKESTVFCERGYYDTKTGIAVFHEDVKLENPPQQLLADSIYYNRETGIGKAFGNIVFTDTAQHALQYSNIATYNEITQTIISTQGSMAGFIIEDDTLYIAGDTIRSVKDSLEKTTTLVYHNVKIFKSDLQGQCDSLTYSDMDSTIRLFNMPVLWSDSTQFTADTILLLIKNSELDQIHLYTNGFIINEDDSLIYNQIKGRNIYGYFRDEELKKIEVIGNGESIYFGKDDGGAYIGVNKMLCSNIDIYLSNRKFNRISFKTAPAAEFHPMSGLHLPDYQLQNFDWMYDQRPKSKDDLLTPAVDQVDEMENPSEDKSFQKDG